MQCGKQKCFCDFLLNNWNLKISVLMTLILLLLYQIFILGLQEILISSKIYLALNFFLFSIKWLVPSKILLVYTMLTTFTLRFSDLFLHCTWLALLFPMLLRSMRLVPCGIIFLPATSAFTIFTAHVASTYQNMFAAGASLFNARK